MTRTSFALLAFIIGCSSSDEVPQNAPDASVDASADLGAEDASAPPRAVDGLSAPTTASRDGVVWEVFEVEGVTPPANPTTGAETPSELNRTRVLRFRADRTPRAEPSAIVIAMPGFLGGAGSVAPLAEAIVAESLEGDAPVEVWAIDRRSNGLEDLRGMDTAEAAGDPSIAADYYFQRATIDGMPYAGAVRAADVSFQSEWGLRAHVGDVHRVIAEVPAERRASRVFLLGHSLGASFAEAYAAWRFDDGSFGTDELAGIILVDGSLGGEPIEESVYREGATGGPIPLTGLDRIRSSSPYVALPLVGVEALVLAEVLALRAADDPSGVVADAVRSRFFRTLTFTPRAVPPMTNRAAIGFAFADGYGPLSLFACSMGAPDGPTEEYSSPLGGALRRPSDSSVTYDWVEDNEGVPPITPIASFSRWFTEGPTNYAEWYFPARLSLDLQAVGGASVPEDGWQSDEGLAAFGGASIDVPILAVATELRTPEDYEAVRDRVGPIGAGRPNEGLSREDSLAFSVLDVPAMTHLDPTSAPRGAENPVPRAVFDFVSRIAGASTRRAR